MSIVITIIGLIAAIPFGIIFFQVAAKFKGQLFELLKTHFSPPVFLQHFLAGMTKVQTSQGELSAFMIKIDIIKNIIINFLRGVGALFWQNPFLTILLVLLISLIFLAMTAGQQFIYLGWARISLGFYDKGTSTVSDLFSKISTLFKGILAGFIYFIIIFLPWKISLILFIIWPNLYFLFSLILASIVMSFYLALKFLFYGFFIVDQDAGVCESLRKSFRLKGGPAKIILLWLIFMVVYVCFYFLFYSFYFFFFSFCLFIYFFFFSPLSLFFIFLSIACSVLPILFFKLSVCLAIFSLISSFVSLQIIDGNLHKIKAAKRPPLISPFITSPCLFEE